MHQFGAGGTKKTDSRGAVNCKRLLDRRQTKIEPPAIPLATPAFTHRTPAHTADADSRGVGGGRPARSGRLAPAPWCPPKPEARRAQLTSLKWSPRFAPRRP